MALTHPWTSTFPTSIDSDSNMPVLTPDSVPGAGDGDRGLVSHPHSLKASLIALETIATTTKQLKWVDGSRTDSYTADGSAIRPYKTIGAALAAITDASASKPYNITVVSGVYPENVVMKAFIDVTGVSKWSVVLEGSGVGDHVVEFPWPCESCLLSTCVITPTAGNTDGIRAPGGGWGEVHNVEINATGHGVLLNGTGGAWLGLFGCDITGDKHGVRVDGDAYVDVKASYLSTNTPASYKDLSVNTGAGAGLDVSVTIGNGLMEGPWTINGGHAVLVLNDSSVSGTSVKDALNTLLDGRAASLKSDTTSIDVGSATAPTNGQVLTATSGTAATWQTPSAGGGFSGRENEFTATGGDQTFTLAATPAVNANMLSGRNIIGVFRNGQRLRYQAVPATGLEFGYTAPTSIVCKSLTAGDIITAVYST